MELVYLNLMMKDFMRKPPQTHNIKPRFIRSVEVSPFRVASKRGRGELNVLIHLGGSPNDLYPNSKQSNAIIVVLDPKFEH